MRDYSIASATPGYAKTTQVAPPPGQPVEQTDLENVSARLNELLNYVTHQRERTLSISDRLLGSVPEMAGEKVNTPARSGIAGGMQDTLDMIFANVRGTDDALTRLRNAI